MSLDWGHLGHSLWRSSGFPSLDINKVILYATME